MRIVDLFFHYWVGVVSIVAAMKWQRLGDIVAGTVAVRETLVIGNALRPSSRLVGPTRLTLNNYLPKDSLGCFLIKVYISTVNEGCGSRVKTYIKSNEETKYK